MSQSKTATIQDIEIILAQPRGFCAGVDRAIHIVERILQLYGPPVYVNHEIVHNRRVVSLLKNQGAIFVSKLQEIPKNAVVVFSAHGVSKSVRAEAEERGLNVFDATCPLVTKVHNEVIRMRTSGHEVVMIGHKGHPEVEGTMGQSPDGIYLVESIGDVATLEVTNPGKIACVTQTTLSVDDTAQIINALRLRFPGILIPRRKDICYATQNRQNAAKDLALYCDVVIVLGSPNSSNSNRLREVAERQGVPSYLIDSAIDLEPSWLFGHKRIGITAGASAPETLVQETIERIKMLGTVLIHVMPGLEEDTSFSLPKKLL